MKTVLTFVLMSFLLVGCSRRDATIQNELAGTWVRHFENGFSLTNVIAADGSYQSQLFGLPDGRIDSLKGTWIAKNGVLIDTVTEKSETNQTPGVMQWQIVHIDRHKLVLSNNQVTNATFDKVER